MPKQQSVFLIVEAGPPGLSTRKMILEMAGYHVLSAVTAGEALTMSKQHPTDAVLFDVNVCDMPARELLAQLKQERPDRPIFLLASRPWPPEELKDLVEWMTHTIWSARSNGTSTANRERVSAFAELVQRSIK